MSQLYTIGFTGKSLEQFIGLLRGAGVDAMVDTRLRNTSQLAGWAKRDDLEFLLQTGFGISYEHLLPFAPSAELLDGYRADGDWPRYEAAYRALLVERHAEKLGDTLFAHYTRPCLLCSEPTAEYCHRRVLAEYLAATRTGVVITHLAIASAARPSRRGSRTNRS